MKPEEFDRCIHQKMKDPENFYDDLAESSKESIWKNIIVEKQKRNKVLLMAKYLAAASVIALIVFSFYLNHRQNLLNKSLVMEVSFLKYKINGADGLAGSNTLIEDTIKTDTIFYDIIKPVKDKFEMVKYIKDTVMASDTLKNIQSFIYFLKFQLRKDT